jgi:hypothetical protein
VDAAQNPLAVGAIGLAVGALIGASAPLSSVEGDSLGGVADAATRAGAGLADAFPTGRRQGPLRPAVHGTATGSISPNPVVRNILHPPT